MRVPAFISLIIVLIFKYQKSRSRLCEPPALCSRFDIFMKKREKNPFPRTCHTFFPLHFPRLVYIKKAKQPLTPPDSRASPPHKCCRAEKQRSRPTDTFSLARASPPIQLNRIFPFSLSPAVAALLYIVEGFGEKFDVGWGLHEIFYVSIFSLSLRSLVFLLPFTFCFFFCNNQ